MSILYKYLPNLGIEYFNNPTFKMSPPLLLNDPFEIAISSNVKKICKHIISDISTFDEKELMSYLKFTINTIGIISLSETHRNLLMWAHYANEHKGFCIGVDDDYIGEDERYSNLYNEAPIQNIPIKIKYDTKRFDFKLENQSSQSIVKSLSVHQLTVKSDDWMYEKEYRSIVNLLHNDKIVFTGKIPRRVHSIMKFLNSIDLSDGANVDEAYLSVRLAMSELSKYREVLFLKKIPSNKIKEVYLGHRFDKEMMRQLLRMADNENHPLHKAKIYKYSVHPSRFELTHKLIHST